MEHSGFFNARLVSGTYDRKYNADDYSDNMAVVINNGVLRSVNDDLKVTANGLTVSVGSGRAWINGKWYFNDSTYNLSVVTPPISGQRYDRVMLRLDKSLSERSISLVYVQGTASSNPQRPAPVRSGNIYDLVLANVFVNTNATSLVVTDTRDVDSVCGYIYSNSKGYLYMRYNWTGTISSATSSVTFDIPQYESDKGFLEVYVNGILDNNSSYTISNNTITFTGTLTAGTVVTVKFYKSIEATGIDSVAGAITTLQNQVSSLSGISKFTYRCTGSNDNIALSEIAQALYAGSYTVGTLSAAAEAFLSALGGNTYLATLTSESHVTITVSGKLGVTTAYSGSGTSVSPYKWFELSPSTVSQKWIYFDFEYCDQIDITCAANTTNVIFYGTDLHIMNCKAYAYCASGTTAITMATTGNIYGRLTFNRCNFKIVTTGLARCGETGDWTDCYLHAKSTLTHAYCILCVETEALAMLVNCTLSAYTGTADRYAAPLGINSDATNAVIMAQNINAPVVAQTGYTQTNLVVSLGGYIQVYGVISTLTSAGDSTKRAISGQIQKNKH